MCLCRIPITSVYVTLHCADIPTHRPIVRRTLTRHLVELLGSTAHAIEVVGDVTTAAWGYHQDAFLVLHLSVRFEMSVVSCVAHRRSGKKTLNAILYKIQLCMCPEQYLSGANIFPFWFLPERKKYVQMSYCTVQSDGVHC